MEHRSLFQSTLASLALCTILGVGTIGLFGMRDTDTEYLLAVARFAPPFGIAGTDPHLLHEEVRSLARAQYRLALAQDTVGDGWRVYTSLHPVAFLSALADLESKRIAYIQNPSPLAARKYLRALTRVASLGRQDAEKFHEALLYYTERNKEWIFNGLAGRWSGKNMMHTATTIRTRMEETAQSVRYIQECTQNIVCPSPDPRKVSNKYPPYSTLTPAQKNIEKFFNAYSPSSGTERYTLTESVCAKALTPPYHIITRTGLSGFERIHLLNALYFTPNPEPIKKEGHTGYTISLPYSFYMCAELQHDAGMIAALQQARPVISIPPELDGTIYEGTAREAIDRTAHEKDIYEVAELLLMFIERSARLESFVGMIAHVHESRLLNQRKGIVMNNSAHNLFLTHSAFPSLFLTHNPDAGTTIATMTSTDPRSQEYYIKHTRSFEELVEVVGFEKLLKDAIGLRDLDNPKQD